MKMFELNGLRTKGKFKFSSVLPIPCKNGIITDVYFVIGYYHKDVFIPCYETELKENISTLVDLFFKEHSIYDCVVLKVSSSIQKL